MAAPEQEFVVRVPNREENKKFHVMKFNTSDKASVNVDFSKWSQARMVRENNEKIFKPMKETDEPKFGAGSAFGKDAKEEARMKKLGIIRKKYNPDIQPWLMRVGGKGGRKYKGVREGGVTANTTYYVFTHGKDGAFEAYPINEWYNFTPMMRYKTLDADEAEEKFAQRGKILNKWAVMVNKKLKPDQEDEALDGDEGGNKKKGGKEKKEFKISDMDDWDGSDDGLDTDEEKEKKDDDDSDGGKKKGRSKDTKKKSKKRKDNDEAFEDSDVDEAQTREVDYMSDESSDSDNEMENEADIKGVDQDEGLSKMLDSESSSSDDDKDKNKDKDEEDDEDETGKKKKKKTGSTANSDDEGKKAKGGSASNSRSGTPTKDLEKANNAEKRKAMVANILDPNASNEPAGKKSRLDQFGSAGGSGSSTGNEAISEDAVRRYLKRRPMTTTDLLKKFRSKKTGIQNAQLVQLLANILKKINPHKQKTKGVTYLSLKEGM